jgi:hypothetical protein
MGRKRRRRSTIPLSKDDESKDDLANLEARVVRGIREWQDKNR